MDADNKWVGWCVDANGNEAGRGNNQPGMTKEACYAQCKGQGPYKGCTYCGDTCVTYSGNVVRGNGVSGFTCYLTRNNTQQRIIYFLFLLYSLINFHVSKVCILLFIFLFIADWKCNSGQGESGKSIHALRSISLDMCGQKCLQFDGCIGFDYTNTDLYQSSSSCRMYGQNTPRTDPGVDHRTYCKIDGEKVFVNSIPEML